MAITIQAQLAKKVPIPGADYSSQQASITITAEVTDLNQVVPEAQRLYGLAAQAVDQQLSGHATTQDGGVAPASASQTAAATAQAAANPHPSRAPEGYPARNGARGRPSQPYRAAQRRTPAPVTDSQLRFLKRLIDQTRAPVAGIFEQYQIGDLAQLSCRDAAQLIDELKQQVPA